MSNIYFFCRNVSKQNYSFSDFPFPDDVPDYPHHEQMQKYIEDYAENFSLNSHINFHVQVNSVAKTGFSEECTITVTKLYRYIHFIHII